MSEPYIDSKWNKDRKFPLRRFLVAGFPVLLIIVAVVFSPFKACNSLGKEGQKNVYSPGQENIGFVKKSNELFEILLQNVDNSVEPTNLETLNKYYRAIDFDLPYASDNVACINGSDLRVVRIHQDCIPEKFREFFFNSRLPQLLEQQSEKICETYFKITLQSKSKGMNKKLLVKSIKLIPSMFKVALGKEPWNGTIYANGNCLFTTANSVFLTIGNAFLPLHRNKKEGLHNSCKLVLDGDFLYSAGTDKQPLDYYNYYMDTYNSDGSVSIMLEGNKDVNICCVGDTLVIRSQFNFNYGDRLLRSGPSQRIAVKDGDKLIFYNGNNRKLAEFSINTDDPSRILSSLTHTSLGTSRYIISRNQTDLFTQQIIQGFCRALSNNDSIDDVHLSLEPFLSREFEKEIKDYLKELQIMTKSNTVAFPLNQKEPEFDISITIMDMATGQVLASPFYLSQFDKELKKDELQMTSRNVALSRRALGSTFKPLVGLASVLTRPDLLNLNTKGMYSNVNADKKDPKATAIFHGRKTLSWAKGTSHWDGTDFVNFIAHSDDVYPVSLVALALAEQGSYSQLPLEKAFEMKNGLLHLRKQQFSINDKFPHWLAELSGANYSDDMPANSDLFEDLKQGEEFWLNGVCPDVTNLHYDTFYDSEDLDFRHRLVTWVLGQGGNEWSCMSIGESWCRMLSKRDVHTRLLKYNSVFPLIRSHINDDQDLKSVTKTWNSFLDKFSLAQSLAVSGTTLRPMYDKVNGLNQDMALHGDSALVLFSKTGTPDSYLRDEVPMLNTRKRYLDVGLYTFALMRKSELQKIKDNKPAKGVVCVVRLTRSYKCMKCGISGKCENCLKGSGFWGNTARDFFVSTPRRLKKLYKMTESYL